MRYLYKCQMKVCEHSTKTITIEKSMNKSDREEYCPKCGGLLKRIYTAPATKTMDGFKV